MKNQSSINYLIIIFCLLQLGFVLSFGSFSLPGIYILIGALALFLVYISAPNILKSINTSPKIGFLFAFLLLSTHSLLNILPTLKEPGILTRPVNFMQLIIIMKLSSLLIIVIGILTIFFKKPFFLLMLAIILTTAIRFSVIYASPQPWVDIYDTIKLGGLELLKGNNPYTATYTKLYPNVTPNYYPYVPGSIFLTLPSTFLFKDPRYVYILAEAITAIFLWKIAIRQHKDQKIAIFIPLIFLVSPVANYLQLRALLEPLVFLFLTISLYFYLEYKKIAFLLLFGILVSIKQTIFILLLFAYKFLNLSFKELIIPLVIYSVIVVPFALWSFKDLWYDIFKIYIDLPYRHDGLTINSLYFQYTNNDIPQIIFILIWCLALVFIMLAKKRGIRNLLIYTSLWYLIFFMFNKYAFGEFYYMISTLILLSTSINGKE